MVFEGREWALIVTLGFLILGTGPKRRIAVYIFLFPRSHRNRFGVIYAEATIDPHIINIMSLSTAVVYPRKRYIG